MDLGETAVLGMAQGTDQGDNIEAELVLGECQSAFGLRPVWVSPFNMIIFAQ
jgi:hypothetical protein